LIGVATTAATALCLSAIESAAPKVSTSGATGALVNFTMAGVIVSKFANITNASDTILGRPLLEQRTISSLSGFIKCRDAHISAPCLAAERGLIESALNGGFYYE
jgi:hypothetical protein